VTVGPLNVEVAFEAAVVFAGMEKMAASGEELQPADAADPVLDGAPDGSHESVREYSNPVRLPLGLRFTAHTREAVRSIPPNEIQFRHLGGPIRGHSERIVVETVGDGCSRVTYRGTLPPSGPLLRLIHRAVAKPAIERIVRSHLATLEARISADLADSETT
jgi:hypothetical protein